MSKENQVTYPDLLWAGTEHSLQLALEAHTAIQAGLFQQKPPEDEGDVPYTFSLQGEVGVISVRGPLVTRDSPYNRYAGVTSYAEVRRAMVYAAQKAEAKAVLLDIDSGGGAVNGVADTGNLISLVNDKVKPVYAFSDGNMASAAYWLGSSAGHLFNSKTATLGSIGVITTHMEVSKMLADMGIKPTVMRAGKYKALANPFEPLTEAAKDQIQAHLDGAYTVFAEHVVDRRHTTMDVFEKKMGQGREFFGETAVTAGLSDGVHTFDSLMTKISASLIDNRNDPKQNPSIFGEGPGMPKQALTEQQIAAIAAGAADPQAAGGQPAEDEPAAEKPPADDTQPSSTEPAAKVTEPQDGNDKIVAFLKGQLVEAQATLASTQLKLSNAEAKITSMQASHDGLMKVAAQSVATMRIALNQAPLKADGLTPEGLLAEHKSASEAFTKHFKAGGVAAVSSTTEKGQPVDAVRQARRDAVGLK